MLSISDIKYFNSDWWCSSKWDFFFLPWRREHFSKPLKISEAVFLELSLIPMGVWHTAAVNHFHKQKSNFWNLRVSVGGKNLSNRKRYSQPQRTIPCDIPKRHHSIGFSFSDFSEWMNQPFSELNSSSLCLDSATHQLSAGS